MDILSEARKSELISKAKQGANYKDPERKGNRFLRRTKCSIASTVKEYNDINMGRLFGDRSHKEKGDTDVLGVTIKVDGETKDYHVGISFNGVVARMAEQLEGKREEDFTFKVVMTALRQCFDTKDVFIYCECPDFRYRFQYWAQEGKGDFLYGNPPNPNQMKSSRTNVENDKGPGCKHICLVLSNVSWVAKVASTINNYVNFFREHRKVQYQKIIFPALFGMSYKDYLAMIESEEQEVDNTGEERYKLQTDKDFIKHTNKYGKTRSQFEKGNKEGIRFLPGRVDDDGNDIEEEGE